MRADGAEFYGEGETAAAWCSGTASIPHAIGILQTPRLLIHGNEFPERPPKASVEAMTQVIGESNSYYFVAHLLNLTTGRSVRSWMTRYTEVGFSNLGLA